MAHCQGDRALPAPSRLYAQVAVAFTFLSNQEQPTGSPPSTGPDPRLLAFAHDLDDPRTRRQASREIRPQDTAMALLKAAASRE